MKKGFRFAIRFLNIAFGLGVVYSVARMLFCFWMLLAYHSDWEQKRQYFDALDIALLYKGDITSFNVIMMAESLDAVLSILFYILALKLVKRVDIYNFFKPEIPKMIFRMSALALVMTIVYWAEVFYTETFVHKELVVSSQITEGSDLVTAAVLFLMALLFEKSIELKQENELTI